MDRAFVDYETRQQRMGPERGGAIPGGGRWRWWLVGAGVWLGLTLSLGVVALVAIETIAFIDEFGTHRHRTGMAAVRHFWAGALVPYLFALTFLVGMVWIGARFAERGGGRWTIFFVGGVLGLAGQLVIMQALLVATNPSPFIVVGLAELVALPAALAGWEWWRVGHGGRGGPYSTATSPPTNP